ncbi:MAG: PhnA domain-containing protein [Robiginitomaculum sp.]
MTLLTQLQSRSGGICELCAAPSADAPIIVTPSESEGIESHVLSCAVCAAQIESGALDPDHMRALSDTMWSQEPAVQAMIYRLLTALSGQAWASEALEMLYLEDSVKDWALAQTIGASDSGDGGDYVPCRDSNGAELYNGDTVTLIKDLVVKGAGFTAKRGTAVRNISLTDNPEHIEGRVNGTRIVLVSAFLKKS